MSKHKMSKQCQCYNHTFERSVRGLPGIKCRKKATWKYNKGFEIIYLCNEHKEKDKHLMAGVIYIKL